MNIFLQSIIEKKKIILISIATIITVIILSLIIYKIADKVINDIDVSNAIHGVVVEKNSGFYKKPKETKWKHRRDFEFGENVYIVDEIKDKKDNKWYKVKAKDKVGYVPKSNVKYYTYNDKDEYALMSDVSKFNIQFKHFENSGEYEVFLINNNINYAYIRAGGRGYGDEGNFYTDPQCKTFIDACEYLGVPYGFYYLDEALDSKEIEEEVKFMENFIKENSTSYNVLPVVLDIESHNGDGRADKIWEDRSILVEELLEKFEEKNINTIIYSNAVTADKYLSELKSKFWLAYYDKQKKIPSYWYTETDQDPAMNEELMNKMIAWQFTENGAGNEIDYEVDISLVKNNFFRQFVRK